MSNWFILKNKSTSGPFSTDEVKTLLKNGLLTKNELIWNRVTNKWTPLNKWSSDAHSSNVTSIHRNDPTTTWYFAQKGKSFGPYIKEQLLHRLSKIKNLKEVLLWTQGMKNWNSLYEFHDILNEIGVNARQHPRANIEGSFKYSIDGEPLDCPLSTVSQGGFGAINFGDFIHGQVIFGELQSPSFDTPIRFSAKVLYKSNSGFVGLKFENINQNDLNKIKNYIDRTVKPGSEDQPIAA